MKICFTLDDVLRAKTKQLCKMYKKYVKPELDLDSLNLEEPLIDELGFNSQKEYNEFLYDDYGFQVFGEANPPVKMVDKEFINWHINIENNDELPEKVDLMIANTMEFNQSIGFTYFYLSKIATRVREVFLPKDSMEIWDKCDVLVTADKKLIENKPEGKIVIKIDMPYNKDCEADYEYEDLSKFLNDNEIINKIFAK